MKPIKLNHNPLFRLVNRTLVANSQSRTALAGIFVLSLLLASPAAQAATADAYWTNAVSGDWNIDVNWNPNGVPPANGPAAAIQNGATVTVTSTPTDYVRFLYIGNGTTGTNGLSSGPGNGRLIISNSTFIITNSGNFYVGAVDVNATASDTGELDLQSNATFLTFNGRVGQGYGSYVGTATLSMTGGSVYYGANNMLAAFGGSANITVDNSSLRLGQYFLMAGLDGSGAQVSDSGVLNITNNGYMSTSGEGDFVLGQDGYGVATLNLSSGQVCVGNWLMLGRQNYALGVINQSGGLLTVTNEWHLGSINSSEGTYNLSGGTCKVLSPYAIVGSYDSSIGTFNQSGGLFTMPNAAGIEYVGFNTYASGTLNLSGGTNAPGQSLFLGYSQGAVGVANLTGGLLQVNNANVGGGDIEVGVFDAAQGTMTISGTAQVNVLYNGNIYIGSNLSSRDNNITMNGGTVTFYADGGTNVGGTGNLVIGNYASWNAANASGDNTFNLNGGTLNIGSGPIKHTSTLGSGELYLNGGTIVWHANNANAIATNFTAVDVQASGAVFDDGGNAVTIPAALLDGGGGGSLTKLGSGVLTLSGANTYSGPTVVSNGTLLVNGSIGSGAVTVASGATLGGNGTVNGPVAVNGTLSPGDAVGSLTMNSSLSLAGNLFIEIDKSLAQTNDYTSVSGSLTSSGTGTVTVTNLNAGLPLAAGDTFKLFNKSVSGGGTMVITPAPGAGLTWGNRLAIDGSIVVNTGVAQNPTNITCSVSGGNLNLGWPEDHIGWTLQAQTNSLGTNWVSVPGSSSVNTESFTINPANGSVFYRLIYP